MVVMVVVFPVLHQSLALFRVILAACATSAIFGAILAGVSGTARPIRRMRVIFPVRSSENRVSTAAVQQML